MGARRRSIAFAVAVSAALLVPLAIFGGSSFAKGFAPTSMQYQYGHKVVICHHTHSKKHPTVTITVDQHAVQAHLRHGDTLGPCSTTTTTGATTVTTSSSTHHSHHHGSSHHSSSKHKGSNENGNAGQQGGGQGNPGHGGDQGNNGQGGGDQGNHGQGNGNGGHP